MKKFAAIFAAAVLVFTLFAGANKTGVTEELPETANISSGMNDL